jgi:hypothetical protein
MLNTLPEETLEALLSDAIGRDRATARRACLLRILWRERFIPRAGLISRVEAELGSECFGDRAWGDNFYRDLRVVKRAFAAAGIELRYSRNPNSEGYYIKGQGVLHPQLASAIQGSVNEVDPAQIDIYRRLTPAQRFQQGCSISNLARQAVAYRSQQHQSNPALHQGGIHE